MAKRIRNLLVLVSLTAAVGLGAGIGPLDSGTAEAIGKYKSTTNSEGSGGGGTSSDCVWLESSSTLYCW